MQRNLTYWMAAMRLRTLPLALSTVLLGAFLAYYDGHFSPSITILLLLTVLFLQILSNLANDYGDSEHGVDNQRRAGPKRAVQSGVIRASQMKNAIIVFSILSLSAGIPLVFFALQGIGSAVKILFLVLGLMAIVSAIKYTVGKNPYGYRGFGDLFVFIFFGIIGVMGAYYLIAKHVNPDVLLPASALGMLSVAVLNLNNLRDVENDEQSGKHTLVVKWGVPAAKWYHFFLIAGSVILGLTYTVLNYHSPLQLAFLITVPFFWMNVYGVFKNSVPALLDPFLKKLALTTLLFSLTFGLGLIL